MALSVPEVNTVATLARAGTVKEPCPGHAAESGRTARCESASSIRVVEHGDDIGPARRAEHGIPAGVRRQGDRVPRSPGAEKPGREGVTVALENEQDMDPSVGAGSCSAIQAASASRSAADLSPPGPNATGSVAACRRRIGLVLAKVSRSVGFPDRVIAGPSEPQISEAQSRRQTDGRSGRKRSNPCRASTSARAQTAPGPQPR